ncbi:MAG: response regulator [Deltaproteobacteria bacterium]|nr:response regulator [Deltaproteobacteria bacterium]
MDAVLGTFALYFRTPRAPDAAAEAVLTRAGALATIAIDAARARAELRDGEARFRTLVDHATDGLFVHDRSAQARIVDVNRQACESLGYARDELIGAMPMLFDQDVDPATLVDLARRLADGETVTFRSVHRRKDGSRFPVEVRIRSFTSKGRDLNLALARDISARVQIEEQLRHAQKMEAIGRLAGGVAHDFNNLLTVIVAHAEGVLPTLAADDPRSAELESIRDAGLRGASLTGQLLAFSRRAIVAPERVDVSALVARLGRMLERLIGEPITLTTALDSGDAQVSVDPGLLEQVLINLVVNARDAMPRGGALEIATARGEFPRDRADAPVRPCVRLTVTDTGVGMTDEIKDRLFEPFFSTRPVGEGSGLGLATCYGIITQAGGTIRIDSTPGKGTRVEVALPMLAAIARPPAPAPSTGAAHATILYVEDEDAVRRVTTRSLERWGYTVITARDGLEALALEARHGGVIDLLLTDVVMPGLGGRALADQLKARRPGIAIVFMSGYTDDEVVREGVNAGVDAFVQKPFTLRALGDRLRAILDEAGRVAGA